MSDFLKGTNLVLIGMMGSGKTTVGQRLAEQLGYRFFDTDAVLEQVAGQSIAAIFAEQGEAHFRDLETKVLAELSSYTRLAIATGGGIVLRRENWSYLRHGVIVWLDVPIPELCQRLQTDTTRPLLQAADLEAQLTRLMQQRQPFYAQADVRVSANPGDDPDAIAQQVIDQVHHAVQSKNAARDNGN